MFRTLLSIVLAASFTSVSLAETAETKAPDKTKSATKAPPKKPAYNPMAEKAKFFKIAGKDNEIDAKEFAAAMEKVGDKNEGFVRKSDKWAAMLKYDKNENGRIDWFEADAYRKSDAPTRRRRSIDPETLKKYDKDGDGKLNEKERFAAWGAAAEEKRQEFMKKYDKDGDGKLDEKEREAIREGFRKRMEDWRRKHTEKRYDKDGDGKLNEEEKAAMEKGEAERAADREKRRKEFMEKYDKDGDGEISSEERRAVGEAMRKKWMERRYDKDKDGKLSAEEKATMEAAQAKYQAERKKRTAEYIKKYDKNGDGKVDEKERPSRRSWSRRRRSDKDDKDAKDE